MRRLEALVAVRRTGTVSAAAASLHYGQSTLSHHLRKLEAETGSVLIQRVGRGVRLTVDGERLAERGEEVLGLLARAEDELTAATSLRAGRVRLAAFPSAAATLVPEVLERLMRTSPGLELELVEAEPPQAVGLLRSGAVDLALTFDYADNVDGVTSLDLYDDPLYLVVARSEPRLRHGDSIADLAGRRWVTGCEQCRSELVHLCRDAGFEPDIAFASDDYVAVQALVASGFGVSILPRLALGAHRHRGVRTTEIPGASRTIRVATHGQPPRPASVDAVITALVETVSERSRPTRRQAGSTA